MCHPFLNSLLLQIREELKISMTRYEAAKRRRKCSDAKAAESNIDDNLDEECSNSVTVQCDTGGTGSCSVEVQTDLTMNDLAALEHDCQQRLNEVHTLKEQASTCTKSYPMQESLSNDRRLLTFYTGQTSMTVFLAVFNFISSVIPRSINNKLTHFECFMLTMMKLRLNMSN